MTARIESATASQSRCPACGEPIRQHDADDPLESCPLCAFKFDDSRTTGKDVTPYALAFEQDSAKLFAMSKWVWTAGPERLKHLAMMRSSPAARRFAMIHFVLLAFALGILRATWLGWRFVSHTDASTGAVSKSTGEGWFRIVPSTPVPGDQLATDLVGLWWNPAQAILCGVIGLISAAIIIALVRLMIRVGIETAHARSYRREHRMTAAQCYATAWLTPILLAIIALCFQPLTLGAAAPVADELLILLPACLLAGISIIFGWFWSLRLAATAPVDTRTRVTIMLALVAPAITCVAATTWWLGLEKLFPPLFDALHMSF